MRNELVSRQLLILVTYLVIGISIFDKQSLLFEMVRSGGLPAYFSLFVLGGAVTVGMLDLALNDLGPCRYRWVWISEYRQLVWMAVAITYCGYALVLIKAGSNLDVVALHTIFGVTACEIAFVDVFQKLRNIESRACG